MTVDESLKALRSIPSIGPSLARDLLSLGIRRVADLKGRDPQALYEQLCNDSGQHHDRCVLYTFRCAVYFASTAKPDPEKLKWCIGRTARPSRSPPARQRPSAA